MRNKVLQGADGINFELQMTIIGINSMNTPSESLKNESGHDIVTIGCYGGKLSVYVNLPHAVRPNNVIPFQISDCVKLESIKNEVLEYIKLYLRKYLKEKYNDELLDKLTVTKMECNVTVKCVGECFPSDVINLFEKAFTKVHLFKEADVNEKTHNKQKRSMKHQKTHEWVLKVYDKTFQQKGYENNKIESNLIRIELVFLDRKLKSMYANNFSISNILTKKALKILVEQYRITLNDIIENDIKNMLNNCTQEIFENLTCAETGKEINETLIKCKEYIVDIEVLRKALKKWYQFRNMPDDSRRVIYYYKSREKYNIPIDVLKTIKEIHKSTNY